jgi:hypothetical protein
MWHMHEMLSALQISLDLQSTFTCKLQDESLAIKSQQRALKASVRALEQQVSDSTFHHLTGALELKKNTL